MKQPRLSRRLSAIVRLAELGQKEDGPYPLVCDIGCDHGWIAITLIQRELAQKVIASDLREGPLEMAAEHVRQYGVSDRIDTVLAGGFSHIRENNVPDCGIIAGMGGYLIRDILREAGERHILPGRLVLQPQNGWEVVRAFLSEAGYALISEDMVYEDGKYYTLLLAGYDKESTDREKQPGEDERDIFMLYGRSLLTGRHPVLHDYLQKEKGKLTRIAKQLTEDSEDLRQIEDRIYRLDRALSYWEG